ncbi:methylenetetrahydrofolate reductase [Schaalia sp. lx-260]|uniref:methylenetetrahydrofolate reductase n=1 Tax=Schaalia sp. lx-260 TaxID=2899082 RepID=UPI001E3059D0|nr:methylenetetrahydrofolate reductase [Schaalia sp. lx-260]MCD4548981.1 methylenetetrahydrofolate reductase [Schaalia sp. lx-260]
MPSLNVTDEHNAIRDLKNEHLQSETRESPCFAAAPTISFELMPPRSENTIPQFWNTVAALEETLPDFISVTYGAGGHNRGSAQEVITRLVRTAPQRSLAHLTCVGASRAETTAVIDNYLANGVRAFLALRGDPPRNGVRMADELTSSLELITLLKQREYYRCQYSASNVLRGVIHPLIIAVATFPAGNPAAGTTPTQEVERLLLKQAAGASFAITQLFYHSDIYIDFVNEARAAGVTIPILAGILPPTHPQRLRRVEELTGVKADAKLLRRLEEANKADCFHIGVEAAATLIRDILASGAPGVHLYTYNQAEPTLAILQHSHLIGETVSPNLQPRRCDWTPHSANDTPAAATY